MTAAVRRARRTAAPAHESPTEFASTFAALLVARRRSLRLRRRQLADQTLPVSVLRAAERGELHLGPRMVTALASRYRIDIAEIVGPRATLIIGSSSLRIGTTSEPCAERGLDPVLRAYLRLIGRVRMDDAETPRTLRREDIRTLADHLGVPCTSVLARLGDLMDAPGDETTAMIDLYLAGAGVVGLHHRMPEPTS